MNRTTHPLPLYRAALGLLTAALLLAGFQYRQLREENIRLTEQLYRQSEMIKHLQRVPQESSALRLMTEDLRAEMDRLSADLEQSQHQLKVTVQWNAADDKEPDSR